MAKTGPQSKTLGRSRRSPCILHAELQNAELRGGRQCGARDWPEVERKPPCMKAGQEVHAAVKDVVPGRWRRATCPGVLCTGFKSRWFVPVSPWPSEASCPKHLLSPKDSLEPSGGKEKRPPLLQVRTLAPTWVKLQGLDCFPGVLLPAPAPLFF